MRYRISCVSGVESGQSANHEIVAFTRTKPTNGKQHSLVLQPKLFDQFKFWRLGSKAFTIHAGRDLVNTLLGQSDMKEFLPRELTGSHYGIGFLVYSVPDHRLVSAQVGLGYLFTVAVGNIGKAEEPLECEGDYTLRIKIANVY